MRIHWLQHVPFEDLGSIATWAAANHCPVSGTQLFSGQSPPALSAFDMLVVMGGPMGISDEAVHPWLAGEKRYLAKAMDAGKRVLGICLGAQLIACAAGARVSPNPVKEIGWWPVERTADGTKAPAGRVLSERATVFHWHGDTFDIPEGAVHLARSRGCDNQAFAIGPNIVGLQYHLEVTPASVAALIDNCGSEVVPARWIQSEDKLRAHSRRYALVNTEMNRLLDYFLNLKVSHASGGRG